MELSRYRIMMRGKDKVQKSDARLHIVRYAQRYGNKPAAREYGCSKNTVKLWRRRFESEGMSGLNDKRDVPRNIPHKTSESDERYIVKCRNKVPCYGPQRLKLFFGIPTSEGAIKRILREHNLTMRNGRLSAKIDRMFRLKCCYFQ